jgi:hypothetical protein
MSAEVEQRLREAFRRRQVLLMEAPDSPKNLDVRREMKISGADYARVWTEEVRATQGRPVERLELCGGAVPMRGTSPVRVRPA